MTQSRPEHKPLLYRLTRAVVKLAMMVFFRKIELRHGEFVPKTGPVLFVANHPNSIMDALVMGVVTKRKVNYIGHAGLFNNRLKSWFLRSTGVIPVYRRDDASEQIEQNAQMFEACYRALEKGETIGIFPEGTSDMLRKVKRLKTGAARIALEAERRNNYELGLQLMPIGLYFFSRSRFRSKVLVNVGKPIRLKPYLLANQADNVAAVQKLTSRIQQSLERITVNIHHEELDQFIREIELLYRDELKRDSTGLTRATRETIAEFFLTQRIADCVEYYYEREPERVLQVQEQVNSYKRKLERLHLKDAMLRDRMSFPALVRAGFFSLARALLGMPVAVYGIANHWIPYTLTERLARRFVDDRTKILSALLIGGGLAFLVFYAVQVLIVWSTWGARPAVLYFLSLPASGFFALAYLREIQQEKQRMSLTFFLFTNKQLYNRMRRERRRLIGMLDQIRDEYVQSSF